ncbi:hypothetical protein PQX77_017804 [Marasmius sp. AFHP31]|nr:hypothetical protein PQX77_017804 [Marasmius sp. AFHP31]
MPDFFPNARHFSIEGGTFSNIQGDQHNYYRQKISREASSASSASGLGTITHTTTSRMTTGTVHINGNQINQIIQREEKEHTEFDDLIGVEGEFTAVTYSGRDARKVFEKEFLKVSRIQLAGASQVFAIANGTIPSMVLWHNLIPLAQFVGNVRGLGLLYLESLRRQLDCGDEELWMDSGRGVICHGPKGPYSEIPGDWLAFNDLPPTAELLQEEVLVRFLASHKSKEADDAFMNALDDAQ